MKVILGGSMKKEKRKEPKLEDLTRDDLDLLKLAYFLQDPHQFVCFGKHYPKLRSLLLVDDENKITLRGRELTKYLMGKLEQ